MKRICCLLAGIVVLAACATAMPDEAKPAAPEPGSVAAVAAAYNQRLADGEAVARLLGEVDGASDFIRYQIIDEMKSHDWTAAERDEFIRLTEDAFEAVDAKNDALVKQLLSEWSWEALYALNPAFVDSAWTAVNHSNDREMQAEVVRGGKALVAKGILDAQRLANLTDRVSLAETGQQVYGTQSDCAQGRRVFVGGGTAGDFEAARQEIGLEPIADYLAGIEQLYGPCPPA